ncbi:trafficking protein particle complex subunit 4 [Acrasis kona]|uniref:Trafficking protein particle complex subunit n=1 Tax=Acrasis kona TaxID=1008807 RepID=A0AAW2Z1K0_9EUKA
MVVYSLYILSKAGGKIFNRDYGKYKDENQVPPYRKPEGNEYLILGSTFHSLHVISSQISPIKGGGGMELLEADTFKLYCYQSPTETKFFLLADAQQQNLDQLARTIYELYADYVMKNPFYEMEMPIHCDLFLVNVEKKIDEINNKKTTN